MSLNRKIKDYFRQFIFLRGIYSDWLNTWWEIQYKINPKKLANKSFRDVFKRDVNWDSPTNLIEKIMWLEFNTDTTLWTKCTDKYLVREYIKECGCEDFLVKLYGSWDDADLIDFDKLPSSFIMKSNNGCGTVIKIEDKSKANLKTIRKQAKKWLKMVYGYNNAQFHYLRIPQRIIAEELLHETATYSDANTNVSLIDYKIWCINGNPESVFVAYNREEGKPLMIKLYDIDWNEMPQYLVSSSHYTYNEKQVIPRPTSLDKMLEACRKLSKPFKEVRVDFYEIDGKPYFGELTFSSGYGYFTEEYYEYLGNKINF